MLGDRYELDREIGRGGMGSVWLGRDTVLRRTVAVKQIGTSPGGGAPDLARAQREARLAARINHQNVVAVFDLVLEDGQQWLVMEHVDGPTLAGLIAERGALDPEDLAPLLAQVAGALAAAHEHGIVHRDVKPSNILLTHEGVAKLSDFGVARAQADASLTQTGLVTGSPAYLSPEVATGRTATSASDVWSLGATMFHALAGRPPYEAGDNLLGAMYRIVHEPPPPLTGGGRLAPLVAAMMQQDPAARPTMAEVEESVAQSVAATPQPVTYATEPADDLEATQGFSPFAEATQPATAAFAPLAAAEPAPAPAPIPPPTAPQAPPVPSDPVTPAGNGRRRNRGVAWVAWVAGIGVALIVAIVVLALLPRGGSGDDRPRAGASATRSPSGGTSQPTAEKLEGFAADYVGTASNDPRKGFAMLTPGYQQQSGGLSGYTTFWGRVTNASLTSVRADPQALTVSYTYSYTYEGKKHTEDVTLQLKRSGDTFLIAGAS